MYEKITTYHDQHVHIFVPLFMLYLPLLPFATPYSFSTRQISANVDGYLGEYTSRLLLVFPTRVTWGVVIGLGGNFNLGEHIERS